MPATTSAQEAVIACDLTAIPDDERAGHIARAQQLLFAPEAECHALPDGIAWRIPPKHYASVVHFIDNERRCCPFFTFELEVTPSGGPLWLRITGSAEAKAVLLGEIDRLQGEINEEA